MSYQPIPALGKDWLTPFYDVLVAMGGLGAPLTKRVLERAPIQDNKAGKLPRFLKEAGFAVQEILPRYKGVHFLLATKDADAQERGRS